MVAVPPLALGTVVDRTPGVELFQIVQTAPTRISVRLLPGAGADPEQVRAGVGEGIAALLTELGLDHVTVESAPEPPEQTSGGKYRTVIPLPTGRRRNQRARRWGRGLEGPAEAGRQLSVRDAEPGRR